MNQKKIGLTGGIGVGKTTASTIFKRLGVPVFNSDQESKLLLTDNQFIIKEVVKRIDSNLLIDNKINRKKLAKIVFSNKKKLHILNEIIHPHVLKIYNQWIKKQKSKYIIKESAILFESKTYQDLDKIILIKSPIKLRIDRVCSRDNKTIDEVMNIIKNQKKIQEIEMRVDYILNNNDSTMLVPQVIQLHKQLIRL